MFEVKHEVKHSRAKPLGDRGSGPLQLFLLTPNFGQLFSWGIGLALLHCNKVDYFKIYLSTIHQIERFEVSCHNQLP